jgi:hypothetical protein
MSRWPEYEPRERCELRELIVARRGVVSPEREAVPERRVGRAAVAERLADERLVAARLPEERLPAERARAVGPAAAAERLRRGESLRIDADDLDADLFEDVEVRPDLLREDVPFFRVALRAELVPRRAEARPRVLVFLAAM